MRALGVGLYGTENAHSNTLHLSTEGMQAFIDCGAATKQASLLSVFYYLPFPEQNWMSLHIVCITTFSKAFFSFLRPHPTEQTHFDIEEFCINYTRQLK